MKIRSITYFLNPEWPLNTDKLAAAAEFIQAAKPAIEAAGYEVQTTRLATIPFPWLFRDLEPDQVPAAAKQLEDAALAAGFNYIAIGPALIDEPDSYALIPDIVAATEATFAAAEIANPSHGVSVTAAKAAAHIITALAPQDPNGFANLFFTAIANVAPGSPFFPGAYHLGDQPKFALATEAASLAVTAFESADTLEDARHNLIAAMEDHSKKLSAAAQPLADQFEIEFGGIDFSLAPFPEEAASLGTAFERLGVPKVGRHGSLAAAAIITEAMDRAKFPRAGMNGLFLPLLEDYTLAARSADGSLSMKDLLMYSAVCGTGLDTIPLPGDTSAEHILPVLVDVAALALRLDKPLTARLMPVPGKQAGEMTSFEFDFFANGRVVALESEPLTGLLANVDRFDLAARSKS